MELRNKYPSPSHCQSSEYYSKPREIVIFTGEEVPDDCPPKLPPLSGVLASPEADHPIVRPVAHRPAVQHPSSIWSSPSTGYGSGSGSCCSDARSLSFLEDPDHGGSSDESVHCESPQCNRPNSSRISKRLWSSPTSVGQGASGRDSADVETILKEKMAEISLLRRTLEENEQVIVKVYAEKEQIWQSEIDRVKNHYEKKLEELRQETAKQILKCSELNKPTNNCCNCQNLIVPSIELWHSPDRDTNTIKPNRRQSLALPASKCSDKNYRNLTGIREYDCNTSLTRSCLVSSSVCSLNEFKEEKKGNFSYIETKKSHHQQQNEEEKDKLRLENEALRIELIETKKDLQRERETLKEDRKKWKEERERSSSYQEQLHQNYIQAWKRGRSLEAQLQATKAQLDKFLHESQC